MQTTIWSLETAKRKHRFSPGLARALSNWLPPEDSVIDLGCGIGTYLQTLAQKGYQCLGIEGTIGIEQIAQFERITNADLALPLTVDWPRASVLCLEVAEHLSAVDEPILLESIDRYCRQVVVISWAIPGQRGTGHINCRPNSYVYERFQRRGFELWPEATFDLRESVEDDVRYFRGALLVFRRT